LPARGLLAKEKLDGIKFSMFLLSMIGKQDDPKRQIEVPTAIYELRSLKISNEEAACLDATMSAEAQNFPVSTGGVAMRYRVELAAAFLAMVIDQSYSSTEALKKLEPDIMAQVMIDLTVARAREIWAQDSA
jgi:hypothetical protein